MQYDRPRAPRSSYPALVSVRVPRAGDADSDDPHTAGKQATSASTRPSTARELDRAGAIVDAARRGEAVAVEVVVTLLAPPVLRAIRALLGVDHPDVEDLVQEVLVAVVDALPSFRGESTLLHFAIRIATRKVTAARRRARAVRGWLDLWHKSQETLAGAPLSPREEAVAERRRRLLRDLLGRLPESQAETLVMRLSLGYSIEDIAEITRAPVNTVRSRLRIGKEAMRIRVESDPRWAELGCEES